MEAHHKPNEFQAGQWIFHGDSLLRAEKMRPSDGILPEGNDSNSYAIGANNTVKI